jgi:hypothetical protein
MQAFLDESYNDAIVANNRFTRARLPCPKYHSFYTRSAPDYVSFEWNPASVLTTISRTSTHGCVLGVCCALCESRRRAEAKNRWAEADKEEEAERRAVLTFVMKQLSEKYIPTLHRVGAMRA